MEIVTGAAEAAATAQAAGNAATEKPDQLIRRMMSGFQLTQLVYVAAKLKIADHLASGPQTVLHLAKVTASHADSAVPRSECTGWSSECSPKGKVVAFDSTPLQSCCARASLDQCARWPNRAGRTGLGEPGGRCRDSVRTGQTGFDLVYGKNTFDWFAETPEAARLFDEFQADLSAGAAGDVAAAYDFSSARVVVDVGGGNGTAARRNPWAIPGATWRPVRPTACG